MVLTGTQCLHFCSRGFHYMLQLSTKCLRESSLVLEHDEHNQHAEYVVLCILSFHEKAGGLYCALRASTSKTKKHCKVKLGCCVMQ